MLGKNVLRYLALAYGFTWAVAGIGALAGIDATSGVAYLVLGGAAMFGPALAALVMVRVYDRGQWANLGLSIHGTRWPILGITALVGVLIVPAYLLVSHVFGDMPGMGTVDFSAQGLLDTLNRLLQGSGRVLPDEALERLVGIPPVVLLAAMLGASVLAACTVNLPFMLGEELGWRGYLWHVLKYVPTWRRVLFTGVAWGLWHAPLIVMGHNYPGFPLEGIGMVVLFCIALALPFDWTRTRSGSVWSSALLHGIINGSAGATALFASGGHVLVGSIAGVAGIIAILLLSLLILVFDARYRAHLLGGPLRGPGSA